MIVMKFGGASLQDAAAVNQVVESQLEWLFQELEQLARAVASLGELTLRSQDAIVSLGERLSSLLVVAAFAARPTPVALVDARQLIITPEQTDQVCGILADACAAVGVEEYAYV